MSFCIGCDQGVIIVEQYDTMSLYHLHPSIEFDNGFANKKWMMIQFGYFSNDN
jgi:hypothetical protein